MYAEFELGRSVVFVGPNNSGKTSALQAITLWELGLRQWAENIKHINKHNVIKTINRYDVFAAPVPSVRQLWKDLEVENNKIEIFAEGFSQAKTWLIGFKFIYANSESINCSLMLESDATEKTGNLFRRLYRFPDVKSMGKSLKSSLIVLFNRQSVY